MVISFEILEPIFAGIIVSVISRYIINNDQIKNCCNKPEQDQTPPEEIDESSSSNTTICSDPNVHIISHSQ